LIESLIQLSHHLSGQLALNVSYLAHFYCPDKVSDAFFAFLSQELFKFVGPQIVEEFLAIFFSALIFANVERDADIN
jgi:3-methyladenine DNA glycosylase Tag